MSFLLVEDLQKFRCLEVPCTQTWRCYTTKNIDCPKFMATNEGTGKLILS